MGALTHRVIDEAAWLTPHRLRRRNDCGDHRPDRAWQLGVLLGDFARRGDCATALVRSRNTHGTLRDYCDSRSELTGDAQPVATMANKRRYIEFRCIAKVARGPVVVDPELRRPFLED